MLPQRNQVQPPRATRSRSGVTVAPRASGPALARTLSPARTGTGAASSGHSRLLSTVRPGPPPRLHQQPKPDTAPAGSSKMRGGINVSRTDVLTGSPACNTWLEADPTSQSGGKMTSESNQPPAPDTRMRDSDLLRLLSLAPWPEPSVSAHSQSARCILDRPYSNSLDDVSGRGVLACLRCRSPLFDMSLKERLHGGFSGFRKCNAPLFSVSVDCAFDVPKIFARCRGCGLFVGELTNGIHGAELRCQLSSLHFVSIEKTLPEAFSLPVDELQALDTEDIQPDAGGSRGMTRDARIFKRADASDSDSDGSRPFRGRPRKYAVEMFSDESDSSDTD